MADPDLELRGEGRVGLVLIALLAFFPSVIRLVLIWTPKGFAFDLMDVQFRTINTSFSKVNTVTSQFSPPYNRHPGWELTRKSIISVPYTSYLLRHFLNSLSPFAHKQADKRVEDGTSLGEYSRNE